MENTKPQLVIAGHSNAVTALAFSNDGSTLVSGSCEQTAIVWDVGTGTTRRLLRLRHGINDLALTPDGTIVVTDDGGVWDALTGQQSRRSVRYLAPLAISENGKMLACSTMNRGEEGWSILLTYLATGRTKRALPCGDYQPRAIAFSSDGKLLGVRCTERQDEDTSVEVTIIYEIETGHLRQTLRGCDISALYGLSLPTGAWLVGLTSDGKQLWDALTGQLLNSIEVEDLPFSCGYSSCAALSPNGCQIVMGTYNGYLTAYETTSARRLWHKPAHSGFLRTIAFSADSQLMATGGDDHIIRLWDATTGEPGRTLGRQRVSVEAVAFSSGGEAISSISENGTARLWRISPACCERQEADRPGVLAFGAPRKPDTARNLWKLDATALPTDAELPHGCTVAAISPDGLLVALNLPGGYISIWNRDTRKLQHTMQSVEVGWVTPVFSPDNRYLVTSTDNGFRVCMFDLSAGEVRKEFDAGASVTEFAFPSDSRLLAAGCGWNAVTLWNVHTGRRKVSVQIFEPTLAMAFATDGKTLGLGIAYEESVWLKSLVRGRKDVRLIGHTDNIRSVDFSPDGTRIATGADDGTVRLWEPESGTLLATFLALPDDEWIVYTPEGDYTGSPGAGQWVLWREGEDLTPATRNQQAEPIG